MGFLFLLDPVGSIQDSDRVSWEDVSLDLPHSFFVSGGIGIWRLTSPPYEDLKIPKPFMRATGLKVILSTPSCFRRPDSS